MKAWIKLGVAAGALALVGCQDKSESKVDQQGWPAPGEGSSAAGPTENVQGMGSQENNAAQEGYGGSGDTNLNTDQPVNQTGPGSAMQPTPDGYGEDTANNDRSTQENTGATSGTPMGTTGGTGGSGEEGTGEPMEGQEVLPDTSDEPRPDENPDTQDPNQPGTGGAGGEADERSEGNTGTEMIQPGETDAKTGEMGTGGAGEAGGMMDAGTGMDDDSTDGVSPESDTTY